VRRRRLGLGHPRRVTAVCRLSHPLGQGLALDELHGVVVDAALAADRVDRHDVRVLHDVGRIDLAAQPAVDLKASQRAQVRAVALQIG
jgi:hypothetical protein